MNVILRLLLVIGFVAGMGFQMLSAVGNITLRFSWWGGDTRHRPTLEAIKLFEAANPGVNVKGEYMGFNGYQERLTTQFSGG